MPRLRGSLGTISRYAEGRTEPAVEIDLAAVGVECFGSLGVVPLFRPEAFDAPAIGV